MGMYTEFCFRANIADEPATGISPITGWLDENINGEQWFENPFDNHEFFQSSRWAHVFIGGGAVYQESRKPIFRRRAARGSYVNELVIASSLKNYGGEVDLFMDWITPHLDMHYGDFLGYGLHEDSCDDGDAYREHPTLYFYGRESVRA